MRVSSVYTSSRHSQRSEEIDASGGDSDQKSGGKGRQSATSVPKHPRRRAKIIIGG